MARHRLSSRPQTKQASGRIRMTRPAMNSLGESLGGVWASSRSRMTRYETAGLLGMSVRAVTRKLHEAVDRRTEKLLESNPLLIPHAKDKGVFNCKQGTQAWNADMEPKQGTQTWNADKHPLLLRDGMLRREGSRAQSSSPEPTLP